MISLVVLGLWLLALSTASGAYKRNSLGGSMSEDSYSNIASRYHESKAANVEGQGIPHMGRRQLQQEAEVSIATAVYNAEQLLGAVVSGADHIVVQEHLDLTTIQPLSDISLLNHNRTAVPQFGRSIQGNCSTPFLSTRLYPRDTGSSVAAFMVEGQCFILVDMKFMDLQQQFWMHGIYIRYTATSRSLARSENSMMSCSTSDCNLWMTNVRLQGGNQRDPTQGGLEVTDGAVYGLAISDFFSSESSMYMAGNAAVTLKNSFFLRNTINSRTMIVLEGDGILRLDNCEMNDNAVTQLLATNTSQDATIFSDVSRSVEAQGLRGNITLPLSEAPVDRPGINESNPWLLETQESASTAILVGDRPPPIPRSSSFPWGIIVTILGSFVAPLLLCLTAIWCWRKRRSADRVPYQTGTEGQNGSGSSGHRSRPSPLVLASNEASTAGVSKSPSTAAESSPAVYKVSSNVGLSQVGSANAQLLSRSESICRSYFKDQAVGDTASPVLEESELASGATTGPRGHEGKKDTFLMTHTEISATPPGEGASQEEKFDFLLQQLDSFGTQAPAFGDLVFLGSSSTHRMQGGQAVVQMAVNKSSREEYAIKFFVDRAAFDQEVGLYARDSDDTSQHVSQFLPQVESVYDNLDGSLQDPSGHALPPCIVMERGESLDKWALRAKPDRFQAATVMSQVAVRLRDLHALEYVHRDLKPGNVMWLPRENRWTIIDFGCVAKTGSEAKLGFSFAYAAPEVIRAYRRGDQTIVAEEAADAWSLGVLAFELLTGKPALPMVHGREEVMDRIEGLKGLQLPWEEGSLSREHKRQLGVWRECVVSLLCREAKDRPSMAAFCDACNRVLSAASTVQV